MAFYLRIASLEKSYLHKQVQAIPDNLQDRDVKCEKGTPHYGNNENGFGSAAFAENMNSCH